MEKKKTINKKNYVVMLIVVILSVLAVFYARSWYIATKEYNQNYSVISTVVNQINEQEITNCVLEKPNVIIYASKGTDNDVKAFEKNFKKIIKKYNLNENMLYINLDNATGDFINILNSLAQNQNIKNKINSNKPSIYIFENGTLSNTIIGVNDINQKQLEKELKEYGVIENE